VITAKLFSFKGILLEVLFTIVNNNPETVHLLLGKSNRVALTAWKLSPFRNDVKQKFCKREKHCNLAVDYQMAYVFR